MSSKVFYTKWVGLWLLSFSFFGKVFWLLYLIFYVYLLAFYQVKEFKQVTCDICGRYTLWDEGFKEGEWNSYVSREYLVICQSENMKAKETGALLTAWVGGSGAGEYEFQQEK